MSDMQKKIDRAIERIHMFQPKDEPYYVCYSGGKDSDVIRLLMDEAGANYELHNNHTTVDAPETVYYIREVMSKYGEMKSVRDKKDGHIIHQYGERGFVHLPLLSMKQLIVKEKILPSRWRRYCCEVLKESGGVNRFTVTGTRWAESVNRKANQGLVTIFKGKGEGKAALDENGIQYKQTKRGGLVLNMDNSEARRAVEVCYRTSKTLINPIIDWEDEDVWDFLHSRGCESNPLYKEGYTRVGCIACPLAGRAKMQKDLERYPGFKRYYLSACEKIIEARKKSGTAFFKKADTPEKMLRWWMGDDPNQITMDDYLKSLEEEGEDT